MSDPLGPLKTYRLTESDNADITGSAKSTSLPNLALQRALGDTVAGFDFGPAVEVTQRKGVNVVKEITWPAFVLLGNGDVLQVLTSIDNQG